MEQNERRKCTCPCFPPVPVFLVEKVATRGVIVIESDPYFEASDGSIIFFDKDGKELFKDLVHLSDYGAELLKPDVLKVISSQN
jgi:hypothetical protein